eukprot:TRINITY_DN466_c1_g2_i1.p1 TRINITY_DN466_c1_g2~~TRINITY_DN466_c1_g2_i1.p1  ORF type:complete len:558 (+),score=168.72 TRINITY_DN466_c1_g2_i1:76-1749(+)
MKRAAAVASAEEEEAAPPAKRVHGEQQDLFAALPDETVVWVYEWLLAGAWRASHVRACARLSATCRRLRRLSCAARLWRAIDFSKRCAAGVPEREAAREVALLLASPHARLCTRLGCVRDAALLALAPALPLLAHLRVDSRDVSDAALLEVARACPAIADLRVDDSHGRALSLEAVAKALAALPSLTAVTLTGDCVAVPAVLLEVLQHASALQSLHVDKISNDGVKMLAGGASFAALRSLVLVGDLRDDAVVSLLQRCPALRALQLTSTVGDFDILCATLADHCTRLAALRVGGEIVRFTGRGVTALTRLPLLRRLHFELDCDCAFDANELDAGAEPRGALSFLEVDSHVCHTEALLSAPLCRALECVCFRDCTVEAAVRALARSPCRATLRRLRLHGCRGEWTLLSLALPLFSLQALRIDKLNRRALQQLGAAGPLLCRRLSIRIGDVVDVGLACLAPALSALEALSVAFSEKGSGTVAGWVGALRGCGPLLWRLRLKGEAPWQLARTDFDVLVAALPPNLRLLCIDGRTEDHPCFAALRASLHDSRPEVTAALHR